ncbi:hypothetical protein L6R49_03065 [Myxococcota bacterium]|nr:hypothetical protein [Myxococcota bacterium]
MEIYILDQVWQGLTPQQRAARLEDGELVARDNKDPVVVHALKALYVGEILDGGHHSARGKVKHEDRLLCANERMFSVPLTDHWRGRGLVCRQKS